MIFFVERLRDFSHSLMLHDLFVWRLRDFVFAKRLRDFLALMLHIFL